MATWQKTTTMALIAMAMLSGCGKNPAAAPETEKRVGQNSMLSAKKAATGTVKAAAPTKTTKTAPAKKPGVSTTSGTKPATGGTTTPVTTGGTTQVTPKAGGEGALRLTIRLWGTSPIGSLKLLVFAPGETVGVEVPMQLTGPEAVWEQDGLPEGAYTLRVQAFDPASKPIGQGSTQAIVNDGELKDLTLDVTTNKVADIKPEGTSGIASEPEPSATPTAAPSTTPSIAPSATPTPAATATPTPAPSGPGYGGTLGLRVEIF